MIRFDFSMLGNNLKLEKIIRQDEYVYPDILEITGEFRILINENIFFSEQYFPILEFLKYALAWISCSDESKEMSYSSVETDDNPLIIFNKKEEGWIICSPWQKYECLLSFTKDELTRAIIHLLETLKSNISNTGDG